MEIPTVNRAARHAADPDWAEARRRCLPIARAIVGNHADAEEVVQEALVRGWRKRHQCRGPHLPWLVEITRREALRLLARRRPELPLDDTPVRASPFPADEIVARLVVRAALGELNTSDQALLALRYEADLTHPAVAACAGLPEGTVKARLFRLRRDLRVALDPPA